MLGTDDSLPGPGEVELDHVGLFVPDMARAAQAFARLGFHLTPLSPQRHRLAAGEALVPAGTANRLAMLEEGYVELLTAVADTPVAHQLREAILRYAGLHLIALGTADAEATHARLATAGFVPEPVIRLERTVQTPAGDRLARFSVVRVPPGAMPEGRIQFCQHHTPELVRQQRWALQPNRARALTDVLLSVADPVEAAARFGRFVGREPESAGAVWWLALGRARIAFVDPGRLARLFPETTLPYQPFMAAFAVSSDDLVQTGQMLARNGLRPVEMAEGVLAAALPGELAGTVCFLAEGVPAPWLD